MANDKETKSVKELTREVIQLQKQSQKVLQKIVGDFLKNPKNNLRKRRSAFDLVRQDPLVKEKVKAEIMKHKANSSATDAFKLQTQVFAKLWKSLNQEEKQVFAERATTEVDSAKRRFPEPEVKGDGKDSDFEVNDGKNSVCEVKDGKDSAVNPCKKFRANI